MGNNSTAPGRAHGHSYFMTRSTNVTAIRVYVTISQPLVYADTPLVSLFCEENILLLVPLVAKHPLPSLFAGAISTDRLSRSFHAALCRHVAGEDGCIYLYGI